MPYSLSEEQIDFILSDIKARGIEMEKLRINLLDHVCCLLEERMQDGDDFEKVYEEIINDFHENGLKGVQHETKGAMRSKHYYPFRMILYVIFTGSITYNIYVASKITREILQYRREVLTIKDITLKEGYNYLKERLKEEYPDSIKKEFTCVFFDDRPNFEYDYKKIDSAYLKFWGEDALRLHKKMDSLAAIYNKVDFVSSFEKSDEATEFYMFERRMRFLNIFYMTGMNKLFSGYNNQKQIKYKSFPTIFVLDKNGKMIYDGEYAFDRIPRLSSFLKSLKNKNEQTF